MADDYLKKYEEEYEAVYGCNNYGQEYDYNQNYGQQQSYQPQSYQQLQQDSNQLSYSDYMKGGSQNAGSSYGKQQTFTEEGFDPKDFYGRSQTNNQQKA